MAKKHHVSLPDGNIILHTDGGPAVVTIQGSGSPAITQPQTGTSIKENLGSDNIDSRGYVVWGVNDDYPREILEKNSSIGVLLRGIEINADIHFGGGLIWHKEVYDGEKRKMHPVLPDGWNTLKRDLQIEEIQSQIIESRQAMGISFIEVLLQDAKKSIVGLQVLDFVNTRFEERGKNGKIKNVVFHPNIGCYDGTAPAKKDLTRIPIYDPMWTLEQTPHKFVIVLADRTFGRRYYPEPNYTSVHRNGWGEVANEVPKLINSIYCNQMSVKYHVIVDHGYFLVKYGEEFWQNPEGCDTEEAKQIWREKKYTEFSEYINNELTNTENAGKAIITLRDEMSKLGVEIKPIENFLDSARELPNAAAANSEMLFVQGVDPAILGSGVPGNSNMNGGGSDKRESFKIKQATLKRPRLVTLRWLYVVAKIYGWPIDVFPGYIDLDVSQTLDENPTTGRNVVT